MKSFHFFVVFEQSANESIQTVLLNCHSQMCNVAYGPAVQLSNTIFEVRIAQKHQIIAIDTIYHLFSFISSSK